MDADEFPPRPSPIEAADMRRRQRGRNVAMLIALILLALLFFGITIAKLSS